MTTLALLDNVLETYSYTIISETNSKVIGHEFNNCHDGRSDTSWKVLGNSNSNTYIDFGQNITISGAAVSGHNLKANQRLRFTYSLDNITYTNLFGNMQPETYNLKSVFAKTAIAPVTARYIRVVAIGFDADTFINNLYIGEWLEGFNISTPFSPNYFQNYEQKNLLNNEGRQLPINVQKKPIAMKLKLDNLQQSDLTALTNIANESKGFMDYVQYHIEKRPFFVMWKSVSGANNTNETHFFALDKSLSTPEFVKPTLLSWTIPVIGYQS